MSPILKKVLAQEAWKLFKAVLQLMLFKTALQILKMAWCFSDGQISPPSKRAGHSRADPPCSLFPLSLFQVLQFPPALQRRAREMKWKLEISHSWHALVRLHWPCDGLRLAWINVKADYEINNWEVEMGVFCAVLSWLLSSSQLAAPLPIALFWSPVSS